MSKYVLYTQNPASQLLPFPQYQTMPPVTSIYVSQTSFQQFLQTMQTRRSDVQNNYQISIFQEMMIVESLSSNCIYQHVARNLKVKTYRY